MHPALWSSVTGVEAQNNDIRVISNNLANVSTTGYKKDRAVFEDLMYQVMKAPGGATSSETQAPSGILMGTGVRMVATQKEHTQGSIIQTKNPLDMAINGDGFFQVSRPDGSIGYTRDGAFQLNENREIVNANGYLLDPGITIPANADSITIGSDGIVSVTTNDSTAVSQVGQVQIATFPNATGLRAVGENLLLETSASGTPIVSNPGTNGAGRLLQSSLESSNVNVVEELVRMIETQRAYEMNAKSIEAVDGMLKFVSQVL